MRGVLLYFGLIILSFPLFGQEDFYKKYEFTEADTLRGALRPERTCFDVHYYDLNIKVDIDNRYLSGFVDVCYTAIEDFERLQLDLFKNMQINAIELDHKKLPFKRIHNAFFVETPLQKKGSENCLRVYYEGAPITARNAPWDGGFVWKKDQEGKDWVGVACEGTGASLWWPNKDHLSDEPDSMHIRVAVPEGLMCVSNGNLVHTLPQKNGFTRYDWKVSYPINNYNVTVNIADYAHFSETYCAEDGDSLSLDYYVLKESVSKAKKQFQQVPEMLRCFEYYFGKYPFWEDGYAMVETPYLGMEHQSAIAYGNKYMRGYLGGLIPPDMDWDYIIIHETGHEYWGNSISCEDHAEMWIHESFTTYMEALYVECTYSYADAVRYLLSQRKYIQNVQPIVGPMDVNWDEWSSSDHYYKGSWILHTLRHVINDDDLWFSILKDFYTDHQRSHITSQVFFDYVMQRTKLDLHSFFSQYLYYTQAPKLLYRAYEKDGGIALSCKWDVQVDDFKMPILVGDPFNYTQIQAEDQRKDFFIENCSLNDFQIADDLFYIDVLKID